MEGALSLMQMAKICGALARLDRARLPYISVLTDPTTGGVTASFAMLGDLNIAEPKALIGFAGPRVIEQTIRQKLPEGFQRSEFLLEKGMLDLVVDRREMKAVDRQRAALHGRARASRAVRRSRAAAVAAGAPSRRHERVRQAVGDRSARLPLRPRTVRDQVRPRQHLARSSTALGHPERAFRSVHVAGTNGKGSVTAMVDAALRAAGHRSARYTSPHLVDLAERFVIDGRPVDRRRRSRGRRGRARRRSSALRADGVARRPADVLRGDDRGRVRAVPARRRRGRGLRGRPRRPARRDQRRVARWSTAITSIALDHQQYLGTTLREIALEKAGIIKPGVPVVVGPLAGARRADAPIERGRARARRRASIRADGRRDCGALRRSACAGAHQSTNAAVAVRRAAERSTRTAFAVPAAGDRARARAIRAGRVGSNAAPGRTAASCCSTRRTTRPAPPRSRPISTARGRRSGRSCSRRCATRTSRACSRRCCQRSSALVVTRASNPRSADPDGAGRAGADDRARRCPISIEPVVDDALAAAWRIRRASSSPDRFFCSATCSSSSMGRDTLRDRRLPLTVPDAEPVPFLIVLAFIAYGVRAYAQAQPQAPAPATTPPATPPATPARRLRRPRRHCDTATRHDGSVSKRR